MWAGPRAVLLVDSFEQCQCLPPAMRLMYRRALAGVCRSSGLAYGFVVHDGTGPWRPRHGGRVVDTGARPVVGGRPYALFAHDWRRVPFERWLTSPDDVTAAGPPAPGGRPRLSRDDFDEAVREALLDGITGSTASGPGARARAPPRRARGRPARPRERPSATSRPPASRP